MKDALHLRYDGPIPRIYAVPHDACESWETQKRFRREYAWMQVRRTGHELVHESKMLRETNSVVHLERWRRLRHQLRWELESWKRWK